ncbi:MAG: twin-arginine translocation signal domain-containing protein [Acidobacteriia bacterium]|nr:twin-arginine translocation signal domain-containing protein [Terriglobia bacterium]
MSKDIADTIAQAVGKTLRRRGFLKGVGASLGAAALGVVTQRRARAMESCQGFTCDPQPHKCSDPFTCVGTTYNCSAPFKNPAAQEDEEAN